MGPGGNPDAIHTAGRDLQGALDTEPVLPAPPALRATPLAGELATAHTGKTDAVNKFAVAKDNGIRAMSRGLVEISTGIQDVDRGGAVAIESLFPSAPPATPPATQPAPPATPGGQ